MKIAPTSIALVLFLAGSPAWGTGEERVALAKACGLPDVTQDRAVVESLLVERAVRALRARDFAAAEAAFAAAPETAVRYPIVESLMTHVIVNVKDLAIFEAWAKAHPKSAWARIAIAEGRLTKTSLQKSLARTLGGKKTNRWKASRENLRVALRAAKADLEASLALEPKAFAYAKLITCSRTLREPEARARELAAKSWRLAPTHYLTHLELFTYLMPLWNGGTPEKALEVANAFYSAHPKSVSAVGLLAEAHIQLANMASYPTKKERDAAIRAYFARSSVRDELVSAISALLKEHPDRLSANSIALSMASMLGIGGRDLAYLNLRRAELGGEGAVDLGSRWAWDPKSSPEKREKGVRLLTASAIRGNGRANYALGEYFMKSGNVRLAPSERARFSYGWCVQAANLRDPRGRAAYAEMVRAGVGTKADPKRGVELHAQFWKEDRNPTSAYYLALVHLNEGAKDPQRVALALDLLEGAATTEDGLMGAGVKLLQVILYRKDLLDLPRARRMLTFLGKKQIPNLDHLIKRYEELVASRAGENGADR